MPMKVNNKPEHTTKGIVDLLFGCGESSIDVQILGKITAGVRLSLGRREGVKKAETVRHVEEEILMHRKNDNNIINAAGDDTCY